MTGLELSQQAGRSASICGPAALDEHRQAELDMSSSAPLLWDDLGWKNGILLEPTLRPRRRLPERARGGGQGQVWLVGAHLAAFPGREGRVLQLSVSYSDSG